MKPYRFANGVLLPKGTMVGAPVGGIHMDDKIYKNAKEFDGFRFSKLREQYGDNPKYYSANTGYDYLHFGHGQRACRGIKIRARRAAIPTAATATKWRLLWQK